MSDHKDKTRNERYDFDKGSLESFEYKNPQDFFESWYQDAHEKNITDPHALVLSTVGENGQPSSRVVYMRELLPEGLVVYTNYMSRKGEEIADNSKVSILFYWDVLERQVRIEGVAVKVDPSISDDYFASRPRISQIGAWASNQSAEIRNRKELEERVVKYENDFSEKVPRPPHWGGFIIKPAFFEFWQGRPGRLHDRLCYEKKESGWKQYRIAP